MERIKLIFNPRAGKKRRLFTSKKSPTLEELKSLLNKYQLNVSYFPTLGPGHAMRLAYDSKNEKYDTVIAAGGDGTVSEVANSLVKSKVTLGILPLGTFMNIARMLSIPNDLEKAVMLLKLGRTRKIDVGSIKVEDGKPLLNPIYFLETAGVGLDAELNYHFHKLEKGYFMEAIQLIQVFINFYARRTRIILDSKDFEVRSTLISIANGPYTGTALKIAPKSKLNDHRLTVTLYKMPKLGLLKYFYHLVTTGKADLRLLDTYKSTVVSIFSKKKQLFHSDGRIFGFTPAKFNIIPNALNVICGFPDTQENIFLNKRTLLDP